MKSVAENWRRINKYPQYEVSDKGNIRHLDGTIRKQNTSNGYAYIGIWFAGKYRNLRVHRLVAEAFIPNPENKLYVNHKDGNKLNNDISNLEWCSASENEQHKVNVLGIKQTPPVLQKAVVCIETNQEFQSINEAAEKMKISRKHIGEAAAGKRKTACGYHWRFALCE